MSAGRLTFGVLAAGVLLCGTPALAAHAPAKAHAPRHATPAGHTYEVTIASMAYGATPAKLKVGDTLSWVNADIFQHSVTARDKSFNLDLKPKAKGTIVLHKAGTIAFYCRYHPGMTGKLNVAP